MTNHKTPNVIFLCFGIFALLFSTFNLADVNPLPTIDSLQQRLTAASEAEDLSEVEKLEIDKYYSQAIEHMRATELFETQTQNYKQVLLDAPQEQLALQRQLKDYRPGTLSGAFEDASLTQIKRRVNKTEGDVTSLRAILSDLNANLDDERSLLLLQMINETQLAINAGNSETVPQPDTKQSQVAQSIAELAERQMQQAKITSLKQRLIYRPVRIALLESKIALTSKQLAGAEALLDEVQRVQNKLDSQKNASLLAKLTAFSQTLSTAPGALQNMAQENLDLAIFSAKMTDTQDKTSYDLAHIQTQITELNAKYASLNRLLELEIYSSSAVLGDALRQEWELASNFTDTSNLIKATEQTLIDSRVTLFSINQHRAPYQKQSIKQLLVKIGPQSEQWRDSIETLIEQRTALISELSNAYTIHVEELSVLLDRVRYLTERTATYRDLLESNLFWIPSASSFNFNTITQAGDSASWLFRAEHWQTVGRAVKTNLSQNMLKLLVISLFLFISLLLRKRLKLRLTQITPDIGKVQSDSFKLTAEALCITTILAMPPALMLFGLSALCDGPSGFANSLSNAFYVGGLMMIYLEFMLQLVRKDGLGETHFRWRETTLGLLRKNNRLLMIVFIPVGIIMTLINAQASAEIRENLGQLSLIILCSSLAIFGSRITRNEYYKNRRSLKSSERFSYFLYALLIVLPLGLIMLSAIGYQYSAQRILSLSLQTGVLGTAALLLYYTADRALKVYARRLALEHIRAKRVATVTANAQQDSAEQSGEGVPEVIDSQELDRHTITSQTKAVVRLVIWVGLIASLMVIWQELSPVVNSLDDIVMWEIASNGPAEAVKAITLWSCLLGIAILIISLIAVRNLPGLLELTVLGRLNLAPGSSYAITTMLKYSIVIIGILVSVNLLGAQWSKLQWLIAALSVGLGFGLQEIVANFVSGIVLLFERPVRLGDTITIAGHTGTVSRIRIRATTVSDWDGKELIIPNKTFITQDFINWTLSDPVTRIIIPVGVAYGSNTQKVVALLLEIASTSKNVFADPPPAALFLAFGASSLDFELRVFARTVVDRAMVTHELHMRIDKEFREQNIEIAFPQRDVHLNMTSPLEVNLKRTAKGNPAQE
ncbi:MAG: small-conductance mechanosensitive channel [Paraglaciecola sp.]|jgi:small-conductance mechanosensitive channel